MPISLTSLTSPFLWGGEEVDVGDFDPFRLIELGILLAIESRADRAAERILFTSEASRRLEVGPLGVVVASVEVERERPFLDDSPERRAPFICGREGDEDAAEDGERSSGVEHKVLVSPFVSEEGLIGSDRGVDI